jgi:transcriptional/translational regulatory protein YebC/TACO1
MNCLWLFPKLAPRISTPPELLYQVKEKLDQMKVSCEEANLEMIPKVYVECDEETTKANEALIEWLEALDDVDAVYHNMKI